jgi:hypothetical protein
MSEIDNTCFRCGGKGVIESAPMSCGVRCWDECPVCGDKAEISRLQSRIEELERALKPFAELGGAWASIPTALPLFIRDEYETIIQGGLTVRAFIDARSALEASNKGGK